MNRVVITGMGSVSPMGMGVSALIEGIEGGKSAVKRMDEWMDYKGMKSLVAAPAKLKDEKRIPRSKRRSMGRMSIFAVEAAEEALSDSGISVRDVPQGRIGCVIGSTMGSSISINEVFERLLPGKDMTDIPSTMFFQCMSHTAAGNVSQYLGLTGCLMATSAACASGLQAVGAGYDLIRLGKQDVLLCGGAEELHPTVTGSFDILFATSAGYNDSPEKTPRPFDKDRDGLVCGEGAGILVLEEYGRALKRNAKIYCEITGYSTLGSGFHISHSDKHSMVECMKTALEDAGAGAGEIDYINAHATATLQGDREEAEALGEVFGDSVPVSSLKGYIGHTLGASGAIELIASLVMMKKSVIYPTLNLDEPASDCGGILHVTKPLEKEIKTALKNCFAFGGVNSTIVVRRHSKA